MDFVIQAVDSGKTVRVVDRIANKEAFNNFLDKDQTMTVSVASKDGNTGNVDILKGIGGAANTYHESDYDVRAGEVVKVDD
jgi:hypothetical protein